MPSDLEEGQQWVFTKARAIARELGLTGYFVWGPKEEGLWYPLRLLEDGQHIDTVKFMRGDLERCHNEPHIQEILEKKVRTWLEDLIKQRKEDPGPSALDQKRHD